MTIHQPRYSKEEFTRCGSDIYDRLIRSQVDTAQDKNKYVALDIETSLWEMDADALTACDRLEARVPDSQTWLVRIGHPYLHRMGGPRRNRECYDQRQRHARPRSDYTPARSGAERTGAGNRSRD